MAGYLVSDERKVTTRRFIEMKQKGEKISMLTSYDFTTAGIVDRAGIDLCATIRKLRGEIPVTSGMMIIVPANRTQRSLPRP